MEIRRSAILALDLVGYTRLMAANGLDAFKRLSAFRAEVVERCVAVAEGRLIKTAGDGMIAELPNAAAAARAAVDIQREAEVREPDAPADRRFAFRIGVASGEIMVEAGDVFGHPVNLAARLEGMAEPGLVLLSDAVRRELPPAFGEPLVDNGPRKFRNVPEPVRVWSWPRGLRAAIGRKPRVALVSFGARSPEAEALAGDLAGEVRAQLGRLTGLVVSERGGEADYVLEGGVRMAGARARVSARLVSLREARQVWSDRYELDATDLFAALDACAPRLATSVRRRVAATEAERLEGRPLDEFGFEELLAYAGTRFFMPTKEGWRMGGVIAEQALALAPDDFMALMMAAAGLGIAEELYGFRRTEPEALALAMRRIDRALTIQNRSDVTHTARAGLLVYGLGRAVDGRAAAERALEINPDFNMAHWMLGAALTCAGDYDEGATVAERAAALAPDDPYVHLYLRAAALAHFAGGRYEIAAERYLRADQLAPGVETTLAGLAASRRAAGDAEGAREAARRLSEAVPDFRLDRAEPPRLSDGSIWPRFLAALHAAGVD